jgi:hypothetical protein
LKLAKIVPLFKSGDSQQISNYRPVSILSLFSKIVEKLMYNRLYSFIEKNDILYKYQFGFREKHSTNLALITLTDKILSAIDKGNIVVGVFLDLKKAFDTVNHNILMKKLYKYGVRGIAYDWFTDYLCNRKQYVCFNNHDSNEEIISCGVPQGSILGPLLFLLYVNDIFRVSEEIFPIIFADDTNVFLEGRNLTDICNSLCFELKKVSHWLQANKLTLNIKKTQYMCFRSIRKKIDANHSINIDGEPVTFVNSCKFIGVTLDPYLRWDSHIKVVKAKVAKGIGVLCKAKKYLNFDTLKMLYYSLIYPHFTYCVEVWGNASAIQITPVLKLQKKIIRILTNSSYHAETANLFKNLKILKLSDIITFFTVLLMFKFVRKELPSSFNDMFQWNYDISKKSSRNSNKLYIPTCRTAHYQKSFRFQGVKQWNNIVDQITINWSLPTFKKHIKSQLLFPY